MTDGQTDRQTDGQTDRRTDRQTDRQTDGKDHSYSCLVAAKKLIKQVDQYKYLGVIVRSINKMNQDLFFNNYRFISDKSQKAIFSMKKKS